MSEPTDFDRSTPRDWSRSEIVSWCERNGKNPALFLDPLPPPNPEPGIAERFAHVDSRASLYEPADGKQATMRTVASADAPTGLLSRPAGVAA